MKKMLLLNKQLDNLRSSGGKKQIKFKGWAWWHMPLIPIQEAEPEGSLSSRTARATQRNPVSKQNKTKQNKTKKLYLHPV
jgi:hypothetical protein